MLKKFLTYFVIFFVALFFVLNSRFVMAQIGYWFSEPIADNSEDTASASGGGASVLPISRYKDQAKQKIYETSEAVLSIPKLGIAAPVVFEKSDNPDVIFKQLEKGVVHYTNTPIPGQDGTAIVLGHSSAYPWYRGKYGSVFALLGKLKVGDKIYVQYKDGEEYAFTVTESFVFNPFSEEDKFEELAGSKDKPALILVSCWPVGTNYRRIAIKAEIAG